MVEAPARLFTRTNGVSGLAIDEHQPLRLEVDLGVELGLPPAKNVGPLLFGGVRGFFKRHVVAVEQTPDRARRLRQTMRLQDMVNQFRECDVAVLRQGYDLIGMRFEVMGAMVIARARGRTLPVRRFWSTHLIVVEGATLKSFAADRRDIPPSTADTSLSRKSIERGFDMQAGLHYQPIV